MLATKTVSRLVLTAALATGLAREAVAGDWDGLYAGIEAGPQFDKSKFKTSSVGPNDVFGVNASTANAELNDSDGRIGGFVGYQMTVMPMVLAGLEADIDGVMGSKSTHTGAPGINYNGVTPIDNITETENYEASLRGRVGTWITPGSIAYATAGVAFRNLVLEGNCPSGSATASWCGVAEADNQTKNRVGWTAGVGAETKLDSDWTVRVEYRYVGLGSSTITLFGGGNQGADAISGKVNLNSQVFTLGLTYHFGM